MKQIVTILSLVTLALSAPHLRAQMLVADYQLQDVYTSEVGTIGPLTSLGSTFFVDATVDGNAQRVLQINAPSGTGVGSQVTTGVQTATATFLDQTNYSAVLLANFVIDPTNLVATKIFDFKNLTTDAGLYINSTSGTLEFIDDSAMLLGIGPTSLTLANYSQIALTRDGTTGLVSVYSTDAMGATSLAFTFNDPSGLAIIGSGAMDTSDYLTLFKDDATGAGGALVNEATQGNIARFRLYDGVLDATMVTGLDRTAVPEPSTLAILALGLGVVALRLRRQATPS